MNGINGMTPLPSGPAPDFRSLLHAPAEFVELLPVAAYACDREGRVLWFNRLAEQLWGRAPRIGDLTDRFCGSYGLYFDGRKISREETPMAQALATGEPVQGVEGVVERPDGSRIWAMVHILPVKNKDGAVVGAVNCFHDTSEFHRMSAELRDKQDELEDFFENGAVPLHIVSGDGAILRANQAELDMLGYSRDEYCGRPITDFHADEGAISEILACLSRGEKIERFPARLRAKDGSVRDVLITSSPRMRDGRFLNTRCFTVDVTAEKAAEERAAESEERYRQLLQALPAAVYTTDAQGRITYYNRAAAEMSGREPELGADKWCVTWRLYKPDGTPLQHDECPMAITLKENRAVRGVEAVAERPDGTRIPFIPFPTPLHDSRGKLVGAVNMLIDISERKQAETSQIVLLKELNHRVKNNMQMLQALLVVAQRETVNTEARNVLADATRRIAAMAAAQKVLYEEDRPTSFLAQDFLKSVCNVAKSTFSDRTDIVVEQAPGSISNDMAMPLALILNELLTNAVKYSGKAQGSGPIRVGLSSDGADYRLWVQDDGPGFEFTRAQRNSSGLGLVEGLARQLGGSFSVERNGGARCSVSFPHKGVGLQ
jgi:PAS domain S-box-containing protein